MDDSDYTLSSGRRDRESELDALETKMLQACKRAYDAWVDGGDAMSPPPQLVKLLKDTHTALMAHVKSLLSDKDRQNMTDEELMLELAQAQERVRRAIERKREAALLLS